MIINDLDGYYIVFDTKNWNTELDTLIINILQDCKCANFPDDSGKQSWCLLSIVSEEHEVITKLREICLDSLPRLSIRLKCWSPILHVQAIWNFQLDAYRRKQVLL